MAYKNLGEELPYANVSQVPIQCKLRRVEQKYEVVNGKELSKMLAKEMVNSFLQDKGSGFKDVYEYWRDWV